MRNIFVLTFILFSFVVNGYSAGDNNLYWQKGNEYYQQKQYDSAAWYFELIATQKPNNADVYYNLGNTYYRLNKIAPAVLNYERALKLNPDYKDARENLVLTQSRINNHIIPVNDIFFIKWWHKITRPDYANNYAVGALVFFLFVLILYGLKLFRKAPEKLQMMQLPGFVIFICLLLLLLSFFSSSNSVGQNTAVVMQSDVPLLNADLKGKPLTLIPEGTTVKLGSEKGAWIEVVLPDGRNGWIQANLITKI